MSAILKELSEVIVATLQLEGVAPEDITRDTRFFLGGLEVDSIDVLELVVAVEERWGVRIDNQELGRRVMGSVGALADFIESQLGGAGGTPPT